MDLLSDSKNSTILQQRLIEVIEEEKHKEQQDSTPFINKKFFTEVFEKFNHKLACEAELTSDDNMIQSEDQE